MKSFLFALAFMGISGLFCCKKDFPESLLEKSTSIKGNRFESQIEDRSRVTIKELIEMLESSGGSTIIDSIKVSDLKVLSTSTYVVEGVDTVCINWTFKITQNTESFYIDLIYNRSALSDFEERDFNLILKNSQNAEINPDNWFDKIYGFNENEIKDIGYLKTMKWANTDSSSILDAFNALSKKRGVNNLKVIRIINQFYIEGKKDTTEFICPINKEDSLGYNIGFFVPSKNEGRQFWHFLDDLLSENDELPIIQ
jgi:hypothetical protein